MMSLTTNVLSLSRAAAGGNFDMARLVPLALLAWNPPA
jgi:hypothetical protein